MRNETQQPDKSDAQTSAHKFNREAMLSDAGGGFNLQADSSRSTWDSGRIRQGAGCRIIVPNTARVGEPFPKIG